MTMLLDHPIDFGGGIAIYHAALPQLAPGIRHLDLPTRLIYPLRQHIGTPAAAVVGIGEAVGKGQIIASIKGHIGAAIHASSSGTVVEISEQAIPNPSGVREPCIIIEPDGKDNWGLNSDGVSDYTVLSPHDIHQRIATAGIVGLGGAGFPSANKLLPGIYAEIELLILNAVECEPYISCDKATILAEAKKVVLGFDILCLAAQIEEAVIAVEEGIDEAVVTALQQVINDHDLAIQVLMVPQIYPAGGERQLIKSLTGIEIPHTDLPMSAGVLVYNVGTAVATYDAIVTGTPLINRTMTLTGGAALQAGNFSVRIGTPINEFIVQAGGLSEDCERLIIGGAMMGFALHDMAAPIIKTTNCILATMAGEFPPARAEQACIRCGDCVVVCPVRLQPQTLLFNAQNKAFGRLQEDGLFDCIECGCCAYACQSHIPLLEYYRKAKAEIWRERNERRAAAQYRQRYQLKNQRLAPGASSPQEVVGKQSIADEIKAAVERVQTNRDTKR